jgi:subtilisin family serine protease
MRAGIRGAALTLIGVLALPLAGVVGGGSAPDAKSRPGPPAAHAPPAFVPGELLVRLEPGARAATAEAILARRDAELRRPLPVPGLWRARLAPGADVRGTARALERQPGVRYAEPNYYAYPHEIPDDLRFGDQWSLHNTGQVVEGSEGLPDADVDAPEAWDLATGSEGITVAIVDDGIAHPHSDLAPNLWTNPGETGEGRETNGIDDDGNGFVDDWRGWNFLERNNDPLKARSLHGTQIAGVIGARGDDAEGIAGINWDVAMMPVRIYNAGMDSTDPGTAARGVGEPATVARIIKAFNYAAENGAQVVNASFGHPTPSQAEREAIAAAGDVLFAVSAGNASRNVDRRPRFREFPCNYGLPNLICTAATDNRDRLAGFSNFGPESVDLAAPGESVLTTSVRNFPRRPFREGFDSGDLTGWERGGRRGRWGLAGDRGSGDLSLADSPRGHYRNRANAWIRSPALDLRGMEGCLAVFHLHLNTERVGDRLLVEASGSLGGWDVRRKLTGSEDRRMFVHLPRRLEGDPTTFIRFRLRTDRRERRDGARIDDLAVSCVVPRDSFQHVGGTSFAAPHVAGAAALVLSLDPGTTVEELRARLLTTVDPLPDLAGKVVTGGRLNLERALTPGG